LGYLGFTGDDLALRDRIQKDAWYHLGGTDIRNISKRSLIIFVNSLNNVYLPWMSQPGDQNCIDISDFNVKNEQEVAQIHYKFFSFWEHRSKIKASSSTHNL
jgi:hypothetical protein